MKATAMLGEIVIKYYNEKLHKGTEKALEMIGEIAVRVSDDCDDGGWYAVATVASVSDGCRIRRIVAEAPHNMIVVRDDVAFDYYLVTAREIAAAGISMQGGLGDEDDLDTDGLWRVAETVDGCRIEVFEMRLPDDEPRWHDASEGIIDLKGLAPSRYDKYLEASKYADDNGIDIYEAKVRLAQNPPAGETIAGIALFDAPDAFIPTHRITTETEEFYVMLCDSGAAYQRHEWNATVDSDYELCGEQWLLQGEPFAGTVEAVCEKTIPGK